MSVVQTRKIDLKLTLAKTLPDSSFSSDGIKQHMYDETFDEDVQGKLQDKGQEKTQDEAANTAQKQVETDAEFLSYGTALSAKDPDLLKEEKEQLKRYSLERVLGSGGMGKVFGYHDHNLKRDVAVKCLKEQTQADHKKVESFIQEARITASLEHSGVLPILDLDMTDNGELYYSMRKVRGESLGKAIDKMSGGAEVVAEIASLNDRVNIIIKVCETLEFAHRRGVLHRDIKPENIMLGELGEVFVVDWGTALITKDQDSLARARVGTPIFMSPEQARREAPQVCDEIYAIGATFFQMLTFRFPMFNEDLDLFWQAKRAGLIDPLTKQERQGIPDQLQAILMKALAAEANDRYQSVHELIVDLRNYQSGLAVSAFHDTVFDFCRRWFRRQKKLVIIVLIMLLPLVAISGIALSTWQSIQDERSRRWQLVFEDNFERKELGDQWQMDSGQADIIDNELWVSGAAGVNARLLVPHGPIVRLEYEAMIPSGSHVSDISTYMFTTPGEIDSYYEPDGYLYGFGTGDNSFSVMRRSGHIMSLREDTFIQAGTWHHIVCEKDETHVRLIVDGNVVFSIQDNYPPRFAEKLYAILYTWRSSMRVKYVRMYTKTTAERARTSDIADEFFWAGQYASAARLYQNVWHSHEGTEIGNTAQFSLALSYAEMESYPKAIELLEHIIKRKDAGRLHLTASLKLAEIHMRAARIEQGLSLAKTALADVEDIASHPEAVMFFDYAFDIVRKVPNNSQAELNNLSTYCNWWLSVFPEHYTVKRGRFFHSWSMAYRRSGDWVGFERVLSEALAGSVYKGGHESLQRLLFQAQWRGRWNEERLSASRDSGIEDLYIQHLFYFKHFDEFNASLAAYRQSESGRVQSRAAQVQKSILESQGAAEALRREWGDAVHTPLARLSMARCYLAAGQPLEAVQVLDLDWDAIEKSKRTEPNQIGLVRWRLAYLAYCYAGDEASAERIRLVAQRVRDNEEKILGSSWYLHLFTDETAKKVESDRFEKWPATSLEASYLVAAETALINNDKQRARDLLSRAIALPYSAWDAIAEQRLQALSQK